MIKSIDIKITKEDLVNLVSCVQPTLEETLEYDSQGLMYFNGNQWSESWAWNKTKLMELSEDELVKLYYKHGKKDEKET